jgi:hypothetical protein
MRSIVAIFSISLSFAAQAQTPADLARQWWPRGVLPAGSHSQPPSGVRDRMMFGPTDLARQLRPDGHALSTRSSPPSRTAYAGSFMPSDLVRLLGFGAQDTRELAPLQIAAVGQHKVQ